MENRENALLIAALDQVAGAIMIYDSDMRALHWNKGFEATFPFLIEPCKGGATMRELMQLARAHGNLPEGVTPQGAQAFTDQRIAQIRAGRAEPMTIHCPDGSVIEARDFQLGPENFASIRVDVTRLQQQRDLIARQADKLSTTNQQLGEFAAIAAHDLRAPLSRQSMMLELIAEILAEDGRDLPAEAQKYWSLVEEGSTRMKQLVEDLLEYAQIETDASALETFCAATAMQECLALLTIPDGFDVRLPPEAPMLRGSATAFKAVLRNLISNAIKHHDAPIGRIDVTCTVTARTACIRVQDDGPGVPDRFKKKIFEPFQRLSKNTSGSGLGLAYIRKTVENWGGTARIDDAEGHGSVFSITAPLATANVIPLAEARAAAPQPPVPAHARRR
ncbi:PAS-domain containing protein [Sulfitobacter albidus]|uniref:histidine kinase n=1 Tax=Sulfitobacter albidus TaxID=2829501 RepID=A0A975JF30_9RHOB|nr:PAS domain-containing sensor histidine kinase [Sulfitobacter albidus]QUJ77332.1 PAS-domain containing protein [Sulfitobacter albidus]